MISENKQNLFSTLLKKIANNSIFTFLIVIAAYMGISLIFYTDIWKQVVYRDPPNILTAQGESHIYEYVAEIVYKNIKSGNNPYMLTSNVFYPKGWNFAPDDVAPINGFYFLFFRPLLSIHQSFMLIVLLSVLLSNLSMYYLLRLIKHDRSIAFLVGAIYGFTPFVSYRIWGHPTYVALYLFTIPTILFLQTIKFKKIKSKVACSILLGLSLSLVILTNLYFAVMWVILISILLFFSYVFERKKLVNVILINYKFLLVAIITGFIVLVPWLEMAYRSFSDGFPPKPSVTDSILLSADLVSIIWPTRNVFYFNFTNQWSSYFEYNQWLENFIYPGLIILLCIFLYPKIRSKLPSFLKILFIVGVVEYLLVLGPRLTFFGKISNITLPYSFFYKIPLFHMARAPGRFIVPVTFLFSIIGAYVITYFFKRLKYEKKVMVFLLLLIIFMIDHSYYQPRTDIYPLPARIYEYLKVHKEGPLVEIPFTVRDGIKNFGFANSVWTVRTQLYHERPIFSLYAGRVPEKAFAEFKIDPFFGPVGQLIDVKTQNYTEIIDSINLPLAKQSLLDKKVKYILIKRYERYTPEVETILNRIGFEALIYDNGYVLWQRKAAAN